jgi:hypothetical protein
MGTWHRRFWQTVLAHPDRAWFLVLALAAVPMFYLILPAPRECPVTKAKCARIEKGISKEEVLLILGVPPGDYTDGGPIEIDLGPERLSRLYLETDKYDVWWGQDCSLYVIYDKDSGLVDEAIVTGLIQLPKSTTIPKRIRRMLSDWFVPSS